MHVVFGFCKKYYQKVRENFSYYKVSNQNKNFLLLNYLFWILFYRRFLSYMFALPLLCIYFILYPFIKFRFIKLIGSAIGHYCITTELLLSELDTLPNDKFINIFYLEQNFFEPSVCNLYLHKMWRRIIFILPLACSCIADSLNKLIMFFLSEKTYGMGGSKVRYERRWARDLQGCFKNKPPHLKFTEKEHQLAEAILQKINIIPNDRYVCLFARSSAYRKGHPNWHYPERNVDISTYMKAAHFLADKGYYVLRMGKTVDDCIEENNPRIIDYSRSSIRSDFMDIYLSANCYFFMTTGSGLDGIPQIFRKPILYTNCFILAHIAMWYPHYLFIPKSVCFTKSNQLLAFKEQMHFFLTHPDYIAKKGFHISDYIKKHGLQFIDNTEKEILEVVEEMEARMSNSWQETKTNQLLQEKFWDVFSTHFKPADYHGKVALPRENIFIKIGANFLNTYQNLL